MVNITFKLTPAASNEFHPFSWSMIWHSLFTATFGKIPCFFFVWHSFYRAAWNADTV